MLMGSSEYSDILSILKALLASSGDLKKVEAKPGDVFDKIEPNLPNGLYVFDFKNGKWVLKEINGDYFKPWEDGLYVVYFDNAKCPACRAYDNYWFPFVKLLGGAYEKAHFVIVLCNWFARECDSPIAKGSFQHYDVHASPTTLLLYVSGGEIRATEKVEGVKKMDELANVIESFLNKTRGPGT